MKVPEEIKATLRVCSGGCDSSCPYAKRWGWCIEALTRDALAYIDRLEAQIEGVSKAYEQVTRERDAAIGDLAIACHDKSCEVCAHYKLDDYYLTERCELEMGKCEFVWRGVPQEGRA